MNQATVEWNDETVEQAVRKACGTTLGVVYVNSRDCMVLWTDNAGLWHVNDYILHDDLSVQLMPACGHSPMPTLEFQKVE